MKYKFTLIVLISSFAIMAANGQDKMKISPVGIWKFDAPYAPEAYNSGKIFVGLDEKKFTADMSFAGSEYKLPGEKVKAENDSLFFSIYIEGQDVKVILKIESENKMTGKAIYSEGEVPLELTKADSTKTEPN